MKVIAFNGSPRVEGNTHYMIEEAAKVLRSRGVEVEEVRIGGRTLRGCNVCFSCKEKKDGRCAIDSDPVNDWTAKMIEVDGIILGSPSYFADLSPELKALIDRAGFVTRAGGGLLGRKVGAAVVAMRLPDGGRRLQRPEHRDRRREGRRAPGRGGSGEPSSPGGEHGLADGKDRIREALTGVYRPESSDWEFFRLLLGR